MADRPDRTERKAPPGRRGLIWLAIFAALLFVPAGTLRWPGAWAFLALMAAASIWGLSWLGRHDPELLAERLRPPFQREQPRSDKILMAAFMPLWFGWYILMALDRRFGWSSVPAALVPAAPNASRKTTTSELRSGSRSLTISRPRAAVARQLTRRARSPGARNRSSANSMPSPGTAAGRLPVTGRVACGTASRRSRSTDG